MGAGADVILYLHLRCPEFEGEVYPFIPKYCAKLVRLWSGERKERCR